MSTLRYAVAVLLTGLASCSGGTSDPFASGTASPTPDFLALLAEIPAIEVSTPRDAVVTEERFTFEGTGPPEFVLQVLNLSTRFPALSSENITVSTDGEWEFTTESLSEGRNLYSFSYLWQFAPGGPSHQLVAFGEVAYEPPREVDPRGEWFDIMCRVVVDERLAYNAISETFGTGSDLEFFADAALQWSDDAWDGLAELPEWTPGEVFVHRLEDQLDEIEATAQRLIDEPGVPLTSEEYDALNVRQRDLWDEAGGILERGYGCDLYDALFG